MFDDKEFDEPTADDLRRRFINAKAAVLYMMAGKAAVTLRSVKTQARFTYRITASKDKKCLFVGVLTGTDNTSDYTYLGWIKTGGGYTKKGSKISADAPSAKAFQWAWGKLTADVLPAELEVWREGRCGRCARPLTDPDSIEQGFGPECIKHVHH